MRKCKPVDVQSKLHKFYHKPLEKALRPAEEMLSPAE